MYPYIFDISASMHVAQRAQSFCFLLTAPTAQLTIKGFLCVLCASVVKCFKVFTFALSVDFLLHRFISRIHSAMFA